MQDLFNIKYLTISCSLSNNLFVFSYTSTYLHIYIYKSNYYYNY